MLADTWLHDISSVTTLLCEKHQSIVSRAQAIILNKISFSSVNFETKLLYSKVDEVELNFIK
jgi:hypothetical protein